MKSEVKKIIIVGLSLIFLPNISLARGQIGSSSADKILSDFVYNLDRHVSNGNEGGFCSYGYDDTVIDLKERYGDIITLDNDEVLSIAKKPCKVLYVGKDKEKVVRSFIGNARAANVVTISLLDSFLDNGGMIHAELGRRSVELTVSYQEIRRSGVRFSPLIYNIIINKE